MSEQEPKKSPEAFWRWARNVNVFGAVALAGAALVFVPYQSALLAGAALNGVQAAGAEAIRQQRTKESA